MGVVSTDTRTPRTSLHSERLSGGAVKSPSRTPASHYTLVCVVVPARTRFVLQENRYASALRYAVDKQHGVHDTESTSSKAMRYLKIGSAVVIGGVAIGLTGGLLAAPLLGAGLAGIGLTSAGVTVSALVASSSGIILVSTLFGIGQPLHIQHSTARLRCRRCSTAVSETLLDANILSPAPSRVFA